MNLAPTQRFLAAAAALARRRFLPLVCLALCGALDQTARAAAPLAGTTIGNAASATYKDSSGTDRAATSNTVTTVVQQVASFTIVANRTATVSPGGQVFFPHIVTNTGNGNETYTIGAINAAGDNFDLTGLTIYADADKNGIPDNTTPITTTGILSSGTSFGFVVVGSAPGSATATQIANVTVSAVGSIATTPQTNTDVTTITSNAVLAVTKAVSANSGAAGSGPYTYTLTYNNTGNGAGTALTITDVVPTGFTYLANSGRWSSTGSTVLTDASAADDQSGIVYDYNITVAGRVTAVIASVSPGQSGTLSFQFNVSTPLAAQTINNTANYSYDPDGAGAATATTPVPTNTVPFTVAGTSGVQLGANLTNDTITTVASALPGATVAFTANLVTNLGNSTDTFNLSFETNTFPTGTTFAFFKSDGNTPLVDTNGDGIPDTGPLAVAGTYNVTVKATLPNVISGGTTPYTINLKATSVNDPTKSDLANDKLTTAAALTVDLTNDAPASDAGTQLGEGTGPEVNPVKTNSTNPGTTIRFTLFAYNPNTVADSYGLTASTDSTFATLTLPTGWSVVFRDTSEAIITSTSVIAAGGNKQFYADVTVPAGNAPGNTETYFRVLSPTTSSGDRIHDRVTVNTVRELSLTPNNSGQTFPGGSVVYEHTLKNNGNVLEGNGTATSTVALALANTLAGWTSIAYFDSNNNGSLDAADAVVTDLSFVSNGTAGLDPGESVRLFTKVFAPPGAPNLAINGTTLTATTTNGTYTATVPAVVTATDTTSVVTGDLTLLKEQVLNANCDGTPTGYAQTQITTGATPGACVKYRITVRNVGSATATNVKIFDATPAFTTYLATPAAAATGGTVNTTIAPANGAAGNFEFNIGNLAAGASATATFTVKINN
jgi:uncharacterized repeat protein (TIGR01451 family)